MPRRAEYRFSLDEHLASIKITGSCCCWKLSKKASSSGGYVQIDIDGIRKMAHRVIYEHLIDSISRGKQLDHLCRNTWCVHPNHVEPVTNKINSQRGANCFNGQHQRARTKCPAGHPLRGSNIIRNSRGWRKCRICQNIRARSYWHRTKKRQKKRQRRAYLRRRKLYRQAGISMSVYVPIAQLQGLVKNAALERGAKDSA